MNVTDQVNSELQRLRQKLDAPNLPAGPQATAAVLVPLAARSGELEVLYIRRSDSVATHRGQIAFPGGRTSPSDANLLATALRETHEEIGLAPSAVEVLGAMPAMRTISGSLTVAPFAGFIPVWTELQPEPREVAEIFTVPLDVLRDQRHRGYYEWSNGASSSRHPAILHQGRVIWGFTYRVTLDLLEMLA
jgi:8-oxo-dGTP pyrophosphatase MutT (NUDIX family)